MSMSSSSTGRAGSSLGPMPERLLLLGGTHEAVALARSLEVDARIETIYSLAGRTRRPSPVPCTVRSGGFGGPGGLEAYLRDARIDLLVDATHPYAALITAHAAMACARASVPRLVLDREPWSRTAGDRWTEVADVDSAARALPALGERALLAIGSRDLEPFLRIPGIRCIVRAVEPPSPAFDLQRHEVMLARGPFEVPSERRLFESRGIDVVVSKNSGGPAARAKIDAARELAIPVVMISRPPVPAGERVTTVGAVLEWIDAQVRASASRGIFATRL